MCDYRELIPGFNYMKEIIAPGMEFPISIVSQKLKYQGVDVPTRVKICINANGFCLVFCDYGGYNFIKSSPIVEIKKSRQGNYIVFTKTGDMYFLGRKTIV